MPRLAMTWLGAKSNGWRPWARRETFGGGPSWHLWWRQRHVARQGRVAGLDEAKHNRAASAHVGSGQRVDPDPQTRRREAGERHQVACNGLQGEATGERQARD